MTTTSPEAGLTIEATPRIGLICHETVRNNQRVVVTNLIRLVGQRFRLSCATGAAAKVPESFGAMLMRKVQVPRLNPYSFGYVLRAARLLWTEDRPDMLICVSHPFPLGFWLLALRRFYPTRIVLRMTGDQFAERAIHGNPVLRLRKYIMHEVIMPRVLRRADALLCVGEGIAEQVVSRGIPKDRVHVLPQPVDTQLFAPITPDRRAAIRAELGIKPGERMALTVGSHTYGKGLDRLPRLVELTRDAATPVHFVTVGDGPMRAALEALGEARLHALGPQPRERTLELFAAADVLVHPTRRDALPNVVLEAIGFGLPVVSTQVGEIPRFVSHIANSDPALAALVVKEDLEAEPVPDWFDWGVQKARYASVFERILSAPARANA